MNVAFFIKLTRLLLAVSVSVWMAGGGIRGGQIVGRTSRDGMTIEDRPVSVPDFLATVCRALGIDRERARCSPLAGRVWAGVLPLCSRR